MYISRRAISFDLGNIFSDESLFEILNNCIPPTFIIGINVIAMTIIPIPPNHWSKALHNKIPFGISSKLEIIVEPVVVIPDILSKNAFVNEKFTLERMKGRDPKIAILNQESAVKRNACCKFNFLSWSKFDKKNKVPKIIVIIDAPKKEVSTSLYIIWAKIGTNMKTPRIIWRIPIVKKTVL